MPTSPQPSPAEPSFAEPSPAEPSLAEQPVTVVSTRVITAGQEGAFEQWLTTVRAALHAQPDRAGDAVVLEQPGGIVHLLYRFADEGASAAWLESERYRRLEAGADVFSIHRQQQRSGPDPRLTLPSEASAPKWKRALMTWAIVFPLLLVLSYATQAALASWPKPVTLALSSMVMTALLTWVILPFITRRLQTWAMRAGDGRVRKAGD